MEMLRACKKRKRRPEVADKKRKQKRRTRVMIGDALVRVLSNLDVSKLQACLTVCKSWYSLIKSVYFRDLWCSNTVARDSEGGLCVLMGNSAFGDRCDVWKPGSGITCRVGLAGFKYSQVVASAGGLVCVVGKPERDPEFKQVALYKVAVGNPMTREWVEIPCLPKQFTVCSSGLIGFRMELLGSRHYRVIAQQSDEEEHITYLYDSVSRSWSPPRKVLFGKISCVRHDETWKKMAIYDIRQDTWDRDWIHETEVTTGLESQMVRGSLRVEYHLLSPFVDVGSFCVWDYNGERFFAAPWMVGCFHDLPGESSCWTVNESPGGFGVWKVANGKLQLVSAVRQQEMLRRVLESDEETDCMLAVKTAAFGYLVCFSPCYTSTFPVVVYNINTGEWDGVFKVKPYKFSHSCKYYDRKNYLTAVVYQPSLACP